MESPKIIEWILIIGVFGMYFGMPFIAREFENLDRRIKAIKVMNIIYLLFTVALIGFSIYEMVAYEYDDIYMTNQFKVTRIALIAISIIMFCYSYFLKQKSWKK